MPSTPHVEARSPGRASPLPPAERRDAIVAAVLPLLIERGASVTSRELAAAAGVAEGTIFKVFDDKNDLLEAAVRHAIDPAPFDRAVSEIDPELDFHDRLVAVTELMQRRLIDIWRLLHQVGPIHERVAPRQIPDYPAVIAIFEAHADRVRPDPVDAVRRLRAITIALSNPSFVDPPLTPAEIVDVFLHGMGTDR